jgi:peptidoglycan/xylan/chitin deacetylase (PgdA/CDA1 family)
MASFQLHKGAMAKTGKRLVLALAAAAAAAQAPCLQPPSGVPGLSGVHESVLGAAIASRGWDEAPVSAASLRDRALVLCWHTFLGDPSLDTDFSIAELGAQLDSLAALGYRFIGLDDALFGRIEGSLNLVATIDDGHRTIPEAVSKAFAARGIKTSLMVYPAVIGSSQYFMKVEDVRGLSEKGSPVGAHGFYHLYLGPELRRENPPSYAKEIFKAKDAVEAMSGKPVYIFAYPFGTFDQIAKADVARAGYAFGLAVQPGFIYKDARLNDLYELPRTVVQRDEWSTLYAFLKRNADRTAGGE